LLAGTVAAFASYVSYKAGLVDFGTELNASFWGAGLAFVVDIAVSVVVTLVTTEKPEEELRGLVYGLSDVNLEDDALAGDARWYRSPVLLGTGALVLAVLAYGVIL
jgi:SSS family solute:Na+ symporter